VHWCKPALRQENSDLVLIPAAVPADEYLLSGELASTLSDEI
jgi:hypothetical protein